MSPLFTAIVIILAILAVMGIVVGVANDAINFLNSAIGSKVAPRRTILWVAAAGILVGTLTSSGMMEVARSGVFYPAQFSFQEIMMLFLGMMLGNVLLLDLYNTLGLPTSTTVSMVFGLLGAAVATALFHIAADPAFSLQDLSQFINTGKAMVIIAAILLSVAFAFVAGLFYMYVSRLIFSFRYAPAFRRWGAVWCGVSLSGILYFDSEIARRARDSSPPRSRNTSPTTCCSRSSPSGPWHPSRCGSSSGCGSTSSASRSSPAPSPWPWPSQETTS